MGPTSHRLFNAAPTLAVGIIRPMPEGELVIIGGFAIDFRFQDRDSPVAPYKT